MTLDLDEVEKACAQATEGPWRWAGPCLNAYAANAPGKAAQFPFEVMSHADDPVAEPSPPDRAFIAGARSWVPELVGEVRRLRAENAQLLEEAAKVAEDTECAGISREWAAAQKAIAAAIRALGAK